MSISRKYKPLAIVVFYCLVNGFGELPVVAGLALGYVRRCKWRRYCPQMARSKVARGATWANLVTRWAVCLTGAHIFTFLQVCFGGLLGITNSPPFSDNPCRWQNRQEVAGATGRLGEFYTVQSCQTYRYGLRALYVPHSTLHIQF